MFTLKQANVAPNSMYSQLQNLVDIRQNQIDSGMYSQLQNLMMPSMGLQNLHKLDVHA